MVLYDTSVVYEWPMFWHCHVLRLSGPYPKSPSLHPSESKAVGTELL